MTTHKGPSPGVYFLLGSLQLTALMAVLYAEFPHKTTAVEQVLYALCWGMVIFVTLFIASCQEGKVNTAGDIFRGILFGSSCIGAFLLYQEGWMLRPGIVFVVAGVQLANNCVLVSRPWMYLNLAGSCFSMVYAISRHSSGESITGLLVGFMVTLILALMLEQFNTRFSAVQANKPTTPPRKMAAIFGCVLATGFASAALYLLTPQAQRLDLQWTDNTGTRNGEVSRIARKGVDEDDKGVQGEAGTVGAVIPLQSGTVPGQTRPTPTVARVTPSPSPGTGALPNPGGSNAPGAAGSGTRPVPEASAPKDANTDAPGAKATTAPTANNLVGQQRGPHQAPGETGESGKDGNGAPAASSGGKKDSAANPGQAAQDASSETQKNGPSQEGNSGGTRAGTSKGASDGQPAAGTRDTPKSGQGMAPQTPSNQPESGQSAPSPHTSQPNQGAGAGQGTGGPSQGRSEQAPGNGSGQGDNPQTQGDRNPLPQAPSQDSGQGDGRQAQGNGNPGPQAPSQGSNRGDGRHAQGKGNPAQQSPRQGPSNQGAESPSPGPQAADRPQAAPYSPDARSENRSGGEDTSDNSQAAGGGLQGNQPKSNTPGKPEVDGSVAPEEKPENPPPGDVPTPSDSRLNDEPPAPPLDLAKILAILAAAAAVSYLVYRERALIRRAAVQAAVSAQILWKMRAGQHAQGLAGAQELLRLVQMKLDLGVDAGAALTLREQAQVLERRNTPSAAQAMRHLTQQHEAWLYGGQKVSKKDLETFRKTCLSVLAHRNDRGAK